MTGALETRIEEKIKPDHQILPWLLAHAVEILNRYSVTSKGKTSHRLQYGRDFKARIAEIGEKVHVLKPDSVGREKDQSRWTEGIYLGTINRSQETVIGTPGE